MSGGPTIAVTRCSACHGRFLPRPAPCPRCGSTDLAPETIPAVGRVVASTEVTAPPAGWDSPHRLALVELPAGIRVLCLVDGQLPPVGAPATVVRLEERYTARWAWVPGVGRGEGDAPGAGPTRPPFEPPR